jgi:hypothetical protein
LKGARAYLTDVPVKHRDRPEYWPVIDKQGTAVTLKYRDNDSGVVLHEKVFLISGDPSLPWLIRSTFAPRLGSNVEPLGRDTS